MNEEWGVSESSLDIFRAYLTFDKLVVCFINEANSTLFSNLYKENGDKLIQHFVYDCERDFRQFITYLTREQLNNTYMYLIRKL